MPLSTLDECEHLRARAEGPADTPRVRFECLDCSVLVGSGRLRRRWRERPFAEAAEERFAAVEERFNVLGSRAEDAVEGLARRASYWLAGVVLQAEPRGHERLELRCELFAERGGEEGVGRARGLAHLPRAIRRQPVEDTHPVRQQRDGPLLVVLADGGLELAERLELGGSVALGELPQQHQLFALQLLLAQHGGEHRDAIGA